MLWDMVQSLHWSPGAQHPQPFPHPQGAHLVIKADQIDQAGSAFPNSMLPRLLAFKSILNLLQMPRHLLVILSSSAAALTKTYLATKSEHRSSYIEVQSKSMLIHFKTV